MDRSDFIYFLNSVRWHCIILITTTGVNDDIDRAVRGVYDIRPEWSKCNFAFEFYLELLTDAISQCGVCGEYVRGVCDIRPEWSKCNFAFEFSLEHLTEN